MINVIAEEENNDPWWYNGGPYNPDLEGTPGGNLINFIANKFFPLLGWYNIGSGIAPKYFYADPSVVEIDYLGNVTVDLLWGTEREERKNWHRFQTNVFREFTLYYEPIFPDNIPKEAFHYTLDPPSLDILEYHEMVGGNDAQAPQPITKLTLFLDKPADPSNFIQDFIFKINVSIHRKYGNLIEIFKLGAFFGGFWNANYEAEIGHKSFELFVKVKPYYNAEIFVSPPIELALEDATAMQIKVENRGSNIEEFGFRIKNNAEKLMVNTPPPITLTPGEIGYVNIGIVTKPLVYDPGTLHSIIVEVYPVDNINMTLATGVLSVRTRGFALQGIFSFRYSWHLFFALVTIIILCLLYWLIKRIKIDLTIVKPKKPWTLTEEKQHLEKLIKKDKKDEYKKTLQMMKDEYTSSLLWYRYYLRFLQSEKRHRYAIQKYLRKIKTRFVTIAKKFLLYFDKFASNISEKIKKMREKREITTEKPEIQPTEKPKEKLSKRFFIDQKKEKDERTQLKQKILKQQQKQRKRLGFS